MRAGQEICRRLLRALGDDACVVLGVVPNAYDVASEFADFANEHLVVKEVTWRIDSAAEPDPDGFPITRPHADGLEFDAFNLWVMAHAWLEDGIVDPAAPYVVYAPDFIPRYVPELYGPADSATWRVALRQFRMMRNSRCVFTTSKKTASDAVVFAGVPPAHVLEMPLFMDTQNVVPSADTSGGEPFILWMTNTARHKNHLVAFDALTAYFTRLKGALDVVLCGTRTEMLDPSLPRDAPAGLHVTDASLRYASDPVLRRHVRILGELSGVDYERAIARCSFLWHPTLYDNGTFAAIDCGRAGKSLVSADYPQMRSIAEYFNLTAAFFDARDPAAAAEALKKAEQSFFTGDLKGAFRVPDDHEARIAAAFSRLAACAI